MKKAEKTEKKESKIFDFKEFRKKKFEDRTKVLILKNFGDSKDEVEWKIRGLDSTDLAEIEDAVQKNKMLSDMADLIFSATSENADSKDKISAVREITGLDDKVPSVLVRKYVVFEKGSVDPKIESHADSIKFAKVFPVEFNRICNEIYSLTGFL